MHDPAPRPPEKPLPMDCCDSGCDRCVFDIYAEELEHYQRELAAWRERQQRRDDGASDGSTAAAGTGGRGHGQVLAARAPRRAGHLDAARPPAHIGVVTDRVDPASGRPLVAHNIGAGPVLEDMLFAHPVTGRYRYLPRP